MTNTPEWKYLFSKYSLNGVADITGIPAPTLSRIRKGAEPEKFHRIRIRDVYVSELTAKGQAEKIRSIVKSYDDEESSGVVAPLFGGRKGGAGGGSNNAGPLSVSYDYF